MTNRKQKVKVSDPYNSWKDIFYDVPQGSILGPLLFNIHLCNLFCFLEDLDIVCYVNDATICAANEKKSLETSSSLLFEWFNINFMRAKSGKSHLIMSCKEAMSVMIDGLSIESSEK